MRGDIGRREVSERKSPSLPRRETRQGNRAYQDALCFGGRLRAACGGRANDRRWACDPLRCGEAVDNADRDGLGSRHLRGLWPGDRLVRGFLLKSRAGRLGG